MTEFAENTSPLREAEVRRAEVEDFLERARETVARTREVIQATRERLGPAPADAPAE